MLGHISDLVKDVCEAIGRRLAEYRTERTRKYGLDASKLKRGTVARGVGRIARPTVISVLCRHITAAAMASSDPSSSSTIGANGCVSRFMFAIMSSPRA